MYNKTLKIEGRGSKIEDRRDAFPASNPSGLSSIFYPPSPILSRRSGFSFAEVMFAVVILGIGFIMVAAVFPVAIQQTQSTGEENLAASIARQATNAISQLPTTVKNPIYDPTKSSGPQSIANLLVFPPTVKSGVKGTQPNAPEPPSIVVPLIGPRWDLIKANAVLPTDPRYAYAAFYRRDNNSSAAQLIVIAMTVRNRSTYSPAVDTASNVGSFNVTTTPSDSAAFGTAPTQTTICPDTVNLGGSAGYVEGSSLSFDPDLSKTPAPNPAGRTYGLGAGNGTNIWELTPGDDMALTAGTNGKWNGPGATRDTTISTAIPATLKNNSTLQPTVAYAQLSNSPDSPSGRITLSNLPPPNTSPGLPAVPANAATGAFVIIADDFPNLTFNWSNQATGGGVNDYCLEPSITGPYPLSYAVGAMNGRIFRLGTPVAGQNGTYNLDPAYGMRPAYTGLPYGPDSIPYPPMADNISSSGPNATLKGVKMYLCAKVYIVGVGRTAPGAATYAGAAQDIGAFVSYFQVQ